MNDIAILFRALQLLAHNAHHLAKGPTFKQDHDWFGSLYEAYEEAYDSIVERVIGEGGAPDLNDIQKKAVKLADVEIGSNDEAFESIQSLESDVRDEIGSIVLDQSDGTQNLLQGLADDSLSRSYLIGQRLKK